MTSDKREAGRGEAIRETAFALMMERGFSKANYSEIARENNCTKALVQYYYPKKDKLMEEFIARALELGEQYLVDHNLKTDSCFVDFYSSGYIHYNFLLGNEALRPLAFDLVAKRAHSAAALEEMIKWQHRYPEIEGIDEQVLCDAVLLSAGGAYELIYDHLQKGIEVDIPTLLAKEIRSFIVNLGLDPSDFSERCARHLLSPEMLVEANEFVLANMVRR